jgi:transposase
MGKSYAPEFRHRVIQRVRAGRPVRTVSADLGVSEPTVFRWVAQDHVDRGESAGLSSIDKVELARARGRIRELEAELAVVKKASEFFTTMEKIRPKGSSR